MLRNFLLIVCKTSSDHLFTMKNFGRMNLCIFHGIGTLTLQDPTKSSILLFNQYVLLSCCQRYRRRHHMHCIAPSCSEVLAVTACTEHIRMPRQNVDKNIHLDDVDIPSHSVEMTPYILQFAVQLPVARQALTSRQTSRKASLLRDSV